MNTNESTTPTTARRPKQYGFQPSPYADKKPVTMRLSKEARDLLDAEARSENTSVTELVEQIVRQRTLRFPDGEKLSAVDFLVDKDEMRRNQESAHAEIARLVAENDSLTEELKEVRSDLADWYEFGPIVENPNSTKKPVHRFSIQSIVKRWPEARQNRYNKLGSPPDEWLKAALETAYDMLDEIE